MSLVGPLDLLDSVEDFSTNTELYGSFASAVTEINGTVYVFVAGLDDYGIQVLRMEGDQLVPVFSVAESNAVSLSYPTDLEVVDTGTERYLVVMASGDDAITSFRIDQTPGATEGQLFAVQSLTSVGNGGSIPSFDGNEDMVQLTTAQGHFIVTPGYYSDGLTVFQVGSDGRMTVVDQLLDSEAPDLNLDTANSVAAFQNASGNYIYVGSDYQDDGISVFSMSATGILTSVQNIEFPGNANIGTMTVVSAYGRNHLVAVDHYNDEVHVYQIAANGTLSEMSVLPHNVYNSDLDYDIFERLETMVIDGVPFVVASAPWNDTVVVFGLGQDGVLTKVQELTAPELDGVVGVTAFVHDGRQYLLGASRDVSRINLMEIGGGDDALLATAGNDQIVGLRGDDDIVALGGNDTVKGGAGEDMISGRGGHDLLDGGADNDVVLGGAGNDSVTGGSGADYLLGGAGFDMASYARSAAGVTINLLTGLATGGDAAGDALAQIEGVTGSALLDVLTGDDVANRLEGGGSRDLLYGMGGADLLRGGNGNDLASGGDGSDRLFGDAGNDVLMGGAGGDVLRGGIGNDSLVGDAGNDQLFGDAGVDHLTGGAGNDTMDGGAGADVFHFAPGLGADRIDNFAIAGDRLDFSTIAEINSLADFLAASVSFGGNTVISLADGSSIYLTGVVETQFTNANFLF